MYLEQIKKANDIRMFKPSQYPVLAQEIREFLIRKVSEHGGHLASNLGAVELTMALHLSFHLPEDKLIFDVGHQCYTHKILTGRREGFDSLRSFGGMSGFPKGCESDCDVFDTGHSSTSISMALGLAKARDLAAAKNYVVAVIGDGSLTGGLAFEALNNAAMLKSNLIIVLNDNNMSISRNIGGLNRALRDMRTAPRYNKLKENVKNALNRSDLGSEIRKGISKTKRGIKQLVIPGMLFEDMGLTYLGPVDGHNISDLLDAFKDAKRLNRPVVVHVVTKKGKGYLPAEKRPDLFHGVGPFDIATGAFQNKSGGKSYGLVASESLLSMAENDKTVCAITAAMSLGTGLEAFHKQYPDRYFDVGIAEEHALSFAAGLAKGGMKPYICIYSTFLQRAYDQLVHDICLQKLPVTLLIDRAGLVGADGETHQGMLDNGFLQTVPGLTILAPASGTELKQMLAFSQEFSGPLAIRYPRGTAPELPYDALEAPVQPGKSLILEPGKDILLFAAGRMVGTALAVRRLLADKGMEATLVNARSLKPLDEDLLKELSATHSLAVVLEDGNRSGGLGEQVEDLSQRLGLSWRVLNTSPDDCFIPHGSVSELDQLLGTDSESITQKILDIRSK